MTDHTGTLVPFTNDEFALDLIPSGDSFKVAAPSLARALGFRDAPAMTRSVPEDEKGYTNLRTPGGDQSINYVTESGFYRVIGQRQASRVKDDEMRTRVERFQSWFYGEVLPEIRRTGGYQSAPELTAPELTGPELMARALIEADSTIKSRDAQIAALTPRAEVADRFLDATGDYSVKDAAGALTRAGVKVGQQRLFSELESRKWIFRGKGDGKWRPYQTAIDSGWVSVVPQSHYHPKTGVLVLDAPQVRVTVKGVRRIASDYGVLDLSAVAS